MEGRYITRLDELLALKARLGVREDWHEPDEQEVTAELRSGDLDNAMLDDTEDTVIISQDGEEVARVNVALLLAWATGFGQ